MAEQNGEVMVTGQALHVPLSQPAIRMSAGVGKVSGETMTSLHTHTQVGTTTEVEFPLLASKKDDIKSSTYFSISSEK